MSVEHNAVFSGWMRIDLAIHDRTGDSLQQHPSQLLDSNLLIPEMLIFRREEPL